MDKKVSIERIADALENIQDLTNELPEVNATDNGKVLTVVDGAWNKADIPTSEAPVSELPEVTASDNGSVLQVVNGEWTKNNNKFEFIITLPNGSNEHTADKTFAEIAAAVEAGKDITAYYHIGNNSKYAICKLVAMHWTGTTNRTYRIFEFAGVNLASSEYQGLILKVTDQDVWTLTLSS